MPMMLKDEMHDGGGVIKPSDDNGGKIGVGVGGAGAGAVGGGTGVVGGTGVGAATGGANTAINTPGTVGNTGVGAAVGGADVAISTPQTPSGNPGGGSPSGGYPSGGGGYVAATVTPGNNAAPIQGGELGDNTNYLLGEYNNMDAYQQKQEQTINDNTQKLIDLANAQIDEQLKVTLAGYANQLDQVKRQYSQVRARLAQAKATEADNIRLANAANGDRGGVGQAQYSAQMQQRDQALYEIDLEQINLEQQLEQAILEAEATGNYNKLAQQIELTSAAYEQLYNLASQVMQTKTNDAAQLDQYYEGIREYDAEYNLQLQQIQQNAVMNKINAGITVTPEDMEQFGLRGTDAQNAANNINQSQGIERQILQEQLRSLQRSNSGGYGGYGSGSGGSSSGSSGGNTSAGSSNVHEGYGGRTFGGGSSSQQMTESQVIAALNNSGIGGSTLLETMSNLDKELSDAQLRLSNLEAHRGQLMYDDYNIYHTQLADRVEYLQNLKATYFG